MIILGTGWGEGLLAFQKLGEMFVGLVEVVAAVIAVYLALVIVMAIFGRGTG